MSNEGLKGLDVWRKAMNFAIKVYSQVVPILPAEEKYGLCQQIRRAAQSIPANIAEGHGRYYYQEGIRFCYIARGSLEEVISHLSLAHELGYLPDDLYQALMHDSDSLNQLINGYISYLKRSRLGEDSASAQALRESPLEYGALDLADGNTEDI